MSKKLNDFLMTAMAGLLSGGVQQVYDRPLVNSIYQQKNCDKKKCKSCAYIQKDGAGRYCCVNKRYVDPMGVACGNYKKRKK